MKFPFLLLLEINTVQRKQILKSQKLTLRGFKVIPLDWKKYMLAWCDKPHNSYWFLLKPVLTNCCHIILFVAENQQSAIDGAYHYGLNDYNPVVLTYITMRSFDRTSLDHVHSEVQNKLDLLYFAYNTGKKQRRCFFVRLAYNLMLSGPTKMICRCYASPIMRWVETFLTDAAGVHGAIITTRSPQGSVISPVLFTCCTSKCRTYLMMQWVLIWKCYGYCGWVGVMLVFVS